MTPQRLTATAAIGAAAALVLATALVGAAPAQALPPTSRVVKDAVEPDKAYDITEVLLRSAPKSTRPAVVVVKHARAVELGDAIEVWFDFDKDRVPDVHVRGDAFSEYTVHKTASFTKDGKDISDQDCVRLAMAGMVSKLRLFPDCLGSPIGYAVAVRSSVDGQPLTSDDWVPATERFTKQVLAAPLS
jgi:hypothetical protein